MNVEGSSVTPAGAVLVTVTAPEKPFEPITDTSTLPLLPAITVIAGGVAVSAKSARPLTVMPSVVE